MAGAAVCKRVGQLGLGANTAVVGIRKNKLGFTRFGAVSSSFPPLPPMEIEETKFCNRFIGGYRTISDLVKANGNHVCLVDTLALARKLAEKGVPVEHAEAITHAITEVLNDSLENVSQWVVSKTEMQRTEMIQETNLCKFKSEVQSMHKHHFSLLQHEAEKMQNVTEKTVEKMQNDIEKTRSDLRHEMDKANAGQRLDWNLEKGRIRDELAQCHTLINSVDNKFDRETNSIRALLEAGKYDVIKYCIGTFFSISAVGLAVVRILM
ncbi:Protein FMP32, mitochondrial [Linum grandiflorum]